MRPSHPSKRIEAKPWDDRISVLAEADRASKGLLGRILPASAHDTLALVVLAGLTITALLTVRDYAISNDEGVQHHYGELIVEYYRSGFKARDLFGFQNLYLYGGLFDVISLALANVLSSDPYEVRHLLCAMVGLGGIAASAATARLIAGPRAGLIAAVALGLCGAWYGAMFNHTKDIPFAAAMAGATLFLLRMARQMPSPRVTDVLVFGLLAGAALGIRSLGLLMFVYLGLAMVIYLPWRECGGVRLRFAASTALRTFPAVALAYLIMILAWPWAALSPLNPLRGLFAFSEFHYAIHTLFAGKVYEMANVPRLYVPGYLMIRVPLVTLAGALIAIMSLLEAFAPDSKLRHRDISLLALTLLVPLACEMAFHGPAFTGIRHFLFLLPSLAALAGIGFNSIFDRLATRNRFAAGAAIAAMSACFLWDATTLVRLHPYENLAYNALVGGLKGAFRRYDMDYWFNSMPEAIRLLEAHVRETTPIEAGQDLRIYSVAVCGERLPFDRNVTLPQLHWDFRSEWDESEFFIAPTHMNCDRDLDGEVVGTVQRLGVPIAYVKDRRAIVKPQATTASSPPSGPGTRTEARNIR
jgi:hypothetical protein